MSLKAVALNVGKCRAKPVMRGLCDNNLNAIQPIWPAGNMDHLEQYPELRIVRSVWHDDNVYAIDAVDVEAGHNEELPKMGTSMAIADTDEYRVM